MAFKKPKYSRKEVSQTFNLKDLLGRKPTDQEKKDFVDLALARILERTQSGQQLSGHKFKQYSKEYAKLKGVNRGDVNLTLTQDMLDSMSSENLKSNLVKIKVGDEDIETEKAFNHNIGDTLPKRTFFGLREKEASEIAKSIQEEDIPRKGKKREKTLGEILDEIGGLRGERVGN